MKGKIRLLPSLKEKKRYVAYKINAEKRINERTARNAICSYLEKFLGELNYGKAGIMLVEQKNDHGIIKTGHLHVNEVKTALALINEIDNNVVNVRSTYVSGVLNKARKRGG